MRRRRRKKVKMSKKYTNPTIDRVKDDTAVDDLEQSVYVQQTIEKGLADVKAGRVASVCYVRAKYGLPECV